jgi:uncharacterized membrane protein YbhN (UPF0104 family)
LLVFIGYLYHNIDRYQQLLNMSAGSLLLLLGLVLTLIFTVGLLNYFLYRGLGVLLTLNESIGLAAVNTLANQLPFAGGLIAKGVYLKQRYELAYTRFLSATLALYVCFIAANGAVGVAVLGYWAVVYDTTVPNLLLLGFLGMAASIFLLCLSIDVSVIPGEWGRRLAQLLAGWQVLSQNRLLIGKLVGLQLLTTLIFAGRLWIAFHILSQDVSLAHCILFSAATIMTNLVSIAPGGLGVREAIVAGIASVLGFDLGVSVVAVGIDRLIATLVIIALGTVYTYILSKQVVNAQSEPEPYEQ